MNVLIEINGQKDKPWVCIYGILSKWEAVLCRSQGSNNFNVLCDDLFCPIGAQ